jgi:hypothetical protein
MHDALVFSHSTVDLPSLKTTQSTFCNQRLSSCSFVVDKFLHFIRIPQPPVRNLGSNKAQIISYDGL